MNLFPRCGLRIVHSKTLSTGGKGDISRAMSKIMATTFKEVALALIRGGFTQATGEMETVEDAEKHAETLMSEIEEGKVGIEWDVIRVVGRKPMKRSGRKTGLRAWAKRVVGRDAR